MTLLSRQKHLQHDPVTTVSACFGCVAAFLACRCGRRVVAPGFVSHTGNTWPLWASELLKALLGSVAVSLSSWTHHSVFFGCCLLCVAAPYNHCTCIHFFTHAHPPALLNILISHPTVSLCFLLHYYLYQ